jgi:hypothetical protein
LSEFAVVAIVICIFAWTYVAGERKLVRQKTALRARRANPTYEEFVTSLRSDCEADIADQLWQDLLVFYRPDMTPHPEDDVIQDMPIDHDEPNDWLAHFCKANNMRVKDISPWPKNQQATIRNLARWFSENRQRLQKQ